MKAPVRAAARLAQFGLFGAVSVTTTLLDFFLFNLLILSVAVPAVAANTISYGVGIAASYLLNKRFTFAGGGRDTRSHEVALFVVLSLGGLVVNNAAVALAAWAVGSPLALNLAKIGAGAATWALKFAAFDRWVYPARPSIDRSST